MYHQDADSQKADLSRADTRIYASTLRGVSRMLDALENSTATQIDSLEVALVK